MVNSRNKGARLEREAVHEAKRHLFSSDACVRTAQVTGKWSSDVLEVMDGFHVEVKGRKKMAVYPFLDQALRDKKEDEVPLLMLKGDRQPWLVAVRVEDAERFAEALLRNRDAR